MRGILKPFLAAVDDKRIIPAYAGNIALKGVANVAGLDHPRVCGEY